MSRPKPFLALGVATVLFSVLIATGCPAPAAPSPTPSNGDPATWKWPSSIFMSAAGPSETAKLVSWAAVLEANTGMRVRVVTEALHIGSYEKLRKQETSLAVGDQHDLRAFLEARDDYARRDLGAFPVRIAWLGSIANAGFIVRGDSPIKSPEDIKPGVKFSVWSMTDLTLSLPRGLAAWAGLDEKDYTFYNAGTVEGSIRAIADGRADIAFAPATLPVLIEVASAPRGIGWLEMNPEKNPDGARRFQQHFPTAFAPMITNATAEGIGVWGMTEWKHDIVHADLSADMVYQLARWFDENFDKYEDKHVTNEFMTIDNLMKSLDTTFLPIHDSLIRYLKEKGRWTPAHDARQKTNLDRLQKYIDGYPTAMALAEDRGVRVDPANHEWQKLWTQYVIDNRIPRFVMHPTLTEDGPVVLFTEEQMPAPPLPSVPDVPAPATPPLEVSGNIDFELVSFTTPLRADLDLTIVAKSEPGTTGTIRFWFANDQESTFTFRGRDTVVADADGKMEFQGTMFMHVIEGPAKFEVVLSKEGRTGTAVFFIEVV